MKYNVSMFGIQLHFMTLYLLIITFTSKQTDLISHVYVLKLRDLKSTISVRDFFTRTTTSVCNATSNNF